MPRFKPTGNDEWNRYGDEVKSLVVKSVVDNSWSTQNKNAPKWKGQRRLRQSMGGFGEEELRQAQRAPRPGPAGSAGLKRK